MENKRIALVSKERSPLESLSRSMHHALPPPSPMNQFENSPVQSDRARSSGHTPALYPIGSTISIGNISGKAKEPASVYFDKTVRPWTITTKEARSFKTTMPRGLIYSWQRRGGDVVSIHSIILEIFDKMINLERKDSLLLFIDTRSEKIFLISTIEKDWRFKKIFDLFKKICFYRMIRFFLYKIFFSISSV